VNHKLEAQKISNKKMNYYSTNNIHHRVSLKEAVLQGLAPDNGLYMPEQIPALSKTFFEYLSHLSFQEIGFAVAKNLIGDDLPEEELKRIVDHTIQFDAPLEEIEKNIYSLELFHRYLWRYWQCRGKWVLQCTGHTSDCALSVR
jgi:threonine synthase